MSEIIVDSSDQFLPADPPVQVIDVRSFTQHIIINPETSVVSVINGGPIGPPGAKGDKGDPGLSGDESMIVHVLDPTPHPAYDDMPSLVLLFENALL